MSDTIRWMLSAATDGHHAPSLPSYAVAAGRTDGYEESPGQIDPEPLHFASFPHDKRQNFTLEGQKFGQKTPKKLSDNGR